MLTGYLMLNRKYDSEYLQKFVKRNLIPLFVCFEIWNMIFYILNRIYGAPYSFKKTLKVAFFLGTPGNVLWFLPMIFCLYLGMPLVSRFLDFLISQGNRVYLGILLFCLIVFGTLVPSFQQVLEMLHPLLGINSTVTSEMQMNVFGTGAWGGSVWMLYLIIGYVFNRFSHEIRKIPTPVFVLTFIVPYLLLVAFRYVAWNHRVYSEFTDPYSNCLLVICSASAFVILHRICNAKAVNGKFALFIEQLSKISFGVYVIHPWITYLCQHYVTSMATNTAGQWAAFLISLVISYVGSALIVQLIQYVKPLRKWLFLMK